MHGLSVKKYPLTARLFRKASLGGRAEVEELAKRAKLEC